MNFLLKKTILALIGLAPLGTWAGSMTLYSKSGNEIWCEDQYAAMNTLRNNPEGCWATVR